MWLDTVWQIIDEVRRELETDPVGDAARLADAKRKAGIA